MLLNRFQSFEHIDFLKMLIYKDTQTCQNDNNYKCWNGVDEPAKTWIEHDIFRRDNIYHVLMQSKSNSESNQDTNEWKVNCFSIDVERHFFIKET